MRVDGSACGGTPSHANDGLGTGKVANGIPLRSRGNADITRVRDTTKGKTVT